MKQVKRLDKSHKAILQYIKKNPKSTQNQIQQAMYEQKICSRMTTLRKLDELIDMKEIKDELKEGDSGFHSYVININQINEYKRINEKLSEIEALFDSFRKLIEYRKQHKPSDISDEKSHLLFEQVVFQSLSMMLTSLLTMTKQTIHSQRDSQIIYGKIIESLINLYTTFGALTTLQEMFQKTRKLYADSIESIMNSMIIHKDDNVVAIKRDDYQSLEREKKLFKMQNHIWDILDRQLNEYEKFLYKQSEH